MSITDLQTLHFLIFKMNSRKLRTIRHIEKPVAQNTYSRISVHFIKKQNVKINFKFIYSYDYSVAAGIWLLLKVSENQAIRKLDPDKTHKVIA